LSQWQQQDQDVINLEDDPSDENFAEQKQCECDHCRQRRSDAEALLRFLESSRQNFPNSTVVFYVMPAR
jgi:hypothetical protein